MKKSPRKIREKKEFEKSYRFEYKSYVDGFNYWTIIHAMNEQFANNIFNDELYTNQSEILKVEEIK